MKKRSFPRSHNTLAAGNCIPIRVKANERGKMTVNGFTRKKERKRIDNECEELREFLF